MKESEVTVILNKRTKKLETFNIHTGELVAQEGELAPTTAYSLELAQAICNMVREGKTFLAISRTAGMPKLHQIYAWRQRHPDFAESLKQARKDRATYFHDKAVDVLEESDTIDKDEVSREKFRFDSFMKLAERGSPDEYAQQTKVHNTGAAPTMIVINTGIDREDPVTIDMEYLDGEQESTNVGRQLGGPRKVTRIGAEVEESAGEGIVEGESRAVEEEGNQEESSKKENQEGNEGE